MDNKQEQEYKKIIDGLCLELISTKIELDEIKERLKNEALLNQLYSRKENSDNVYRPSGVHPIISESISYFFKGFVK